MIDLMGASYRTNIMALDRQTRTVSRFHSTHSSSDKVTRYDTHIVKSVFFFSNGEHTPGNHPENSMKRTTRGVNLRMGDDIFRDKRVPFQETGRRRVVGERGVQDT
jgi:hypothetical protein